jgi:hypothetical protein
MPLPVVDGESVFARSAIAIRRFAAMTYAGERARYLQVKNAGDCDSFARRRLTEDYAFGFLIERDA